MGIFRKKTVIKNLLAEISAINMQEELQRKEILEAEKIVRILKKLRRILTHKKYAKNKREVNRAAIIAFKKMRVHVNKIANAIIAEEKPKAKKFGLSFFIVEDKKIEKFREKIGEERALAAKKIQLWARIKDEILQIIFEKNPISLQPFAKTVLVPGTNSVHYSHKWIIGRHLPNIIKNLEVLIAYEKKQISLEEFFKHEVLSHWKK